MTVTVVVPFHNAAATIARTLESISRQTKAPHEVIVVDDASRSDDAAALAQLAGRTWAVPVRVIHLDANEGPAQARNRGWDAASGDWVAFCDADDEWAPSKVATQLEIAQRDGAALVATLRATDPDAPFDEPGTVQSRPLTGRRLLFLNTVVTSSVMIRADRTERFTPGRRHSEDYELWLRILLSGARGSLVPRRLVRTQHAPHEARGLSSQHWRMIRGEFKTYSRVRADGLVPLPLHVAALTVAGVRTGIRMGLVAARHAMSRSRR